MTAIVVRWAFALILVAATFNPSGFSYIHWAQTQWQTQMPLVVLAGLLLLVGYIIYVRATLRAIGAFGIILIAAIFAALVWVGIDYGWLRLENSQAMSWVMILGASIVLGIGLSWSIIRRRLSGQSDVDDVDA